MTSTISYENSSWVSRDKDILTNIIEYRIQNTKYKNRMQNKKKQAGAELGQAQLKLGQGFTSTIDS